MGSIPIARSTSFDNALRFHDRWRLRIGEGE
jgi:hypothetical protein